MAISRRTLIVYRTEQKTRDRIALSRFPLMEQLEPNDLLTFARVADARSFGRAAGRLRVAMPSDLAILVLADPLAAFIALHPAVSLELDLSARRVDLLGENVDVAVPIGTPPEDALLAARRVGVFPIGLYAAPAYFAEHGDPASPDDLAQHDALRLLGRVGEPARWRLLQGDRRWEGVAGRASASSPELLIRLARAGSGIASVPDLFAAPSVRRGELRRVLSSSSLPPHTVWAVFPGRRLMPAKVRSIIDMLATALPGRAGRPVSCGSPSRRRDWPMRACPSRSRYPRTSRMTSTGEVVELFTQSVRVPSRASSIMALLARARREFRSRLRRRTEQRGTQ